MFCCDNQLPAVIRSYSKATSQHTILYNQLTPRHHNLTAGAPTPLTLPNTLHLCHSQHYLMLEYKPH
ncbi:hypothetical protein E2C01_030061 [Portunus trituberculatus]|uniref:Uncharacterized protein n=1 Tax=Portunus trituberculatus TaxID=210409 RepID=A0A5B7EU63_PORTR|nr:hypothetical protein [Portunus trituberculatus]